MSRMQGGERMKIEGFGGLKFWMQRVAEEHIRLAKDRMDRVNLLLFQSYNFDKMQDEYKNKVIKELLKDINEVFGEEGKRIEEEYFNEVDTEGEKK